MYPGHHHPLVFVSPIVTVKVDLQVLRQVEGFPWLLFETVFVFVLMVAGRALDSQIVLDIFTNLLFSFSPDVRTKNRHQHPRVDADGEDKDEDHEEDEADRVGAGSHYGRLIGHVVIADVEQREEGLPE